MYINAAQLDSTVTCVHYVSWLSTLQYAIAVAIVVVLEIAAGVVGFIFRHDVVSGILGILGQFVAMCMFGQPWPRIIPEQL